MWVIPLRNTPCNEAVLNRTARVAVMSILQLLYETQKYILKNSRTSVVVGVSPSLHCHLGLAGGNDKPGQEQVVSLISQFNCKDGCFCLTSPSPGRHPRHQGCGLQTWPSFAWDGTYS